MRAVESFTKGLSGGTLPSGIMRTTLPLVRSSSCDSGASPRPEVHLIGIILGLPLVIRVLRTRKLDRTTRSWFMGLLGVTIPAHLFRYLYYGSLIPNTFFVKTGGSDSRSSPKVFVSSSSTKSCPASVSNGTCWISSAFMATRQDQY